jgi:hypothetical protein
MVAGVLVDGDATMAVGGTVTAIDGEEIWAFGHPFLGGGAFSMPLAKASVVAILPSQASSFKFFAVGEILGAFGVDRMHGVWGKLGDQVPMVPIEVEAGAETYSFRCVRHPVLFPLLVGYLTLGSHAAHGRTFGDQTVTVHVELSYQGAQTAVAEEVFSSADASALASEFVSAVVAYLENSPFDVPELESVRVRVQAAEELQWAEIVDAVPDRLMVRPGESLGVRLRMRPYRGQEVVRHFSIEVPEEAREGALDLIVADGSSWDAYDLQIRPSRPGSFADELRLLGRLVPSNRVVLAFERSDTGVALQGGNLQVPPSVLLTLRSGLGTNVAVTAHQVVRRTIDTLPFPVLGASRIPLRVRLDGDRLQQGGRGVEVQ